MILWGFPLVQQAAIGNCLSFDPFPFDQNGLAPPEVDVGGRQVADALMLWDGRLPLFCQHRLLVEGGKHAA
jgi:hypothetical protein